MSVYIVEVANSSFIKIGLEFEKNNFNLKLRHFAAFEKLIQINYYTI